MNTPNKMPRFFLQCLSALAIAVGTGLLVAGSTLFPVVRGNEVGEALAAVRFTSWEAQRSLELASGLKGVGAGFLTLGVLGLVLPWINSLVHHPNSTVGGSPTPPTAP